MLHILKLYITCRILEFEWMIKPCDSDSLGMGWFYSFNLELSFEIKVRGRHRLDTLWWNTVILYIMLNIE